MFYKQTKSEYVWISEKYWRQQRSYPVAPASKWTATSESGGLTPSDGMDIP